MMGITESERHSLSEKAGIDPLKYKRDGRESIKRIISSPLNKLVMFASLPANRETHTQRHISSRTNNLLHIYFTFTCYVLTGSIAL